MARHRKSKARGSSKAGRPRKEGERYPSGRLKPPGPNERTIVRRKAGDSEAGEHPIDFAYSQGWLNEVEHRAASSYRAAYDRTHIGGPRMSHGGLCEVVPSEELRLNWSQLSDEEIAAIFDQVFNITAPPEDRAKLDDAALGIWKRLNTALNAEEREELFMVCVLGSWPLWMPKRAADKALGARDARRVASLKVGLGAVSRALRPEKPKPNKIQSLPAQRKSKAHLTEMPVRYETQHGDEITPTSKHGTPFTVTVLRKRA
jgi:hypothetical protein